VLEYTGLTREEVMDGTFRARVFHPEDVERLREYVVVHGRARVTDGGAVSLLSRLAPLYLGDGADYPPPSMQSSAGYVTRITPIRFMGIGPWAR